MICCPVNEPTIAAYRTWYSPVAVRFVQLSGRSRIRSESGHLHSDHSPGYYPSSEPDNPSYECIGEGRALGSKYDDDHDCYQGEDTDFTQYR